MFGNARRTVWIGTGLLSLLPIALLAMGVWNVTEVAVALSILTVAAFAWLKMPRMRPATVVEGGGGTALATPPAPTRSGKRASTGRAEAMLARGQAARLLTDLEKMGGEGDVTELKRRAVTQIESRMSLVPPGAVSLSRSLTPYGGANEAVAVPAFLLDKFEVTNAQFQQFVSAGGYDDPSLWPLEILPHVVSFRDRTGRPGPRYWSNGRCEPGTENLPVVGVSWYEARAYAVWAGMRLPTEAEWELCATWNLDNTPGVTARRYPWGDAMDRQRCNLWGSGFGKRLPVDALPLGAAPNGVQQLIGNVWEWIEDDFSLMTDEGQWINTERPAKAVRGGAFDTYFESQSGGTFRSGLESLARRPNVGFRCALDLAVVPELVNDES